MSKTLLDDNDHWIATEGGREEVVGAERSELVLRISQRVPGVVGGYLAAGEVTVPLNKLHTALRRAHGPRRSWDDFFLDMAALIATRSKDPSTQVGAVIVDGNKRIVSMGYNGFARGVDDSGERLNNRDVKYPLTLHAELNAILFAHGDLEQCTIYVWPSPPCTRCAAAIIQTGGIIHVVSPPASKDMLSRWKAELELAEDVLAEAGVVYVALGEAVE